MRRERGEGPMVRRVMLTVFSSSSMRSAITAINCCTSGCNQVLAVIRFGGNFGETESSSKM